MAFNEELVNALIESMAREIEIVTGDKIAAKIVRDHKLPIREVNYLKGDDREDYKKETVTPSVKVEVTV